MKEKIILLFLIVFFIMGLVIGLMVDTTKPTPESTKCITMQPTIDYR